MMQSTTPVSIIVRTTGVHLDMLAAALESLISQNHEDLEVIVVQDGGDSAAIVMNAIPRSNKKTINFIPIEKGGRSKAGNAGLEASQGRYLGFLDEDDELLPDHVSLLAAKLDATTDVAAVYAQAYEIKTDSQQSLKTLNGSTGASLSGRAQFSKLALMYKNYLPIQSVLFRRKLFETYGGFDEKLDAFEDWDLWLKFCETEGFLAIPEVTSLFRTPHNRAKLYARAVRHEKYRPVIRAKQKNMKVNVAGMDILDEHVSRMEEQCRDGRFLYWLRKIRRLFQPGGA